MLEKQVRQIIKIRSTLHPNDLSVYMYWDKLTELLSMNELQTIKLLETCSEEEIEWISEVFEDVAYKLQSVAYIKCLERLDKKYPNLNLTKLIMDAKEMMDTEDRILKEDI
ncbi:hypothetical protein C1X05_14665 [Laceyella sacchari]|jgi:hypothetical protein|uniref:hypothetical protein n=1 Tax=Laceyella tengchongensis TaxID=574699 RepID=UPI000C9F06F4|nr:hypothetical protein C1X05_14665 [Laceyella sacchari]MRG29563.1 hypothetical protein [Laceyella tengchongensis]